MEGVRNGGPSMGHGNIFDFFTGGGRGGMREDDGPKKGKDVVRALPVTLEDLYCSLVKKIKVTRTRNCKDCEGKGTKDKDALKKCKGCNGEGRKMEYRKLGPGFVQQVQVGCDDCRGEGITIDEKSKCGGCFGKKVVNEPKTLEIYIDKGMKDGQKITFENEADERPDILAGDIVFVLQMKVHELFERDGIHLYMKKKINLLEALSGFQFKIKHLDSRTLLVTSDKTDILKPNSMKQIDFEGMPTWKSPFDKGHLFIKFEVEFPHTIPEEMVSELIKILPQKNKVELLDGEKEIELEEPKFDANSKRREEQQEEEENQRGGNRQGVSCQTQ